MCQNIKTRDHINYAVIFAETGMQRTLRTVQIPVFKKFVILLF